MIELLTKLLSIPSPTFQEREIADYMKAWMFENYSNVEVTDFKDSLICHFPKTEGLKHICLVGHSDVVPAHFEPYVDGDKLHGSGVSDMLSAIAAFMDVMKDHAEEVLKKFNISILIYSREEGTKMEDNGLHDLIAEFPEYFNTVDLAIVGEPTDNTIQIGCVGSCHAEVIVKGMACHSARPWNGENALYKALPLINAFSKIEPEKHTLFGVDFFDVMGITESHSEKGRTSLPGYWRGNINFRYAPVYTIEEAETKLINLVDELNVPGLTLEILDTSPCGSVIETDLFKESVEKLGAEVCAKQAWTDVAQLTAHGISAFNFGPGLTSQAHKEDEFAMISDIVTYRKMLVDFLVK